MKHNSVRNRTLFTLLTGMVITSLNAPLTICAQDDIDLIADEFTEEASTSFKTNCSQVEQFGNFKTTDTLTIPGSEYKSIISERISKIDVKEVAHGSESPNVSLNGLDKLSGQIEYQITSSLPISTTNLNPSNMVEWYGDAVSLNRAQCQWINQNGNKADGIKIVFDVEWGKLVCPQILPYLEDFNSTNMPDLKIHIDVKNLKLAEKQELGKPFTLTGSITKYTVNTVDKSPLEIMYSKYSEPDKFGDSIKKYYAGSINFSEEVNRNLPSASAMIHVGEKTVFNHSNNSSSQNRPNGSTTNKPGTGQTIVLRLYNPVTGEHLFTSNAAERAYLVDNGWKNEYCEWNTPATSDSPIYRLCNPNNDDHHYTANKAEKDMLVQLGWRDEGVHFYSANKNKGIPVYRMYNPNATGVGSHHYTSSQEERDSLRSFGWNYEGIAWYGLPKEE